VLFGSQDATLYCLNAKTGELVWKYTAGDQIRCSPTIVGDRAFVAGCDGKLHIVDLTKGEAAASVPIDSPTGSTPAVLGDHVFFGTNGSTFYSVDWKNASVTWNYKPDRAGSIQSSAAVAEDIVAYGGQDKGLHALKPGSGDELWTFTAKAKIDSSPVICGERVYVGASDGRVYGIDRKSGEKSWEYEAGGKFTAAPAIAAGRLVIGNTNGTLYCFGKK
jgi:outer membrane protein assembly factor BamB